MKVYFLEVKADDLTLLDGSKYATGVIDVYSNNSYVNYSVTKSNYGFTPTRATWVGTTRLDTGNFLTWEEIEALDENFTTDSGEVLGGRFIDMSGRVDIISFNVSQESTSVRLTAYHSDVDDDDFFEEEWDYKGPVSTSNEIALIGSERYVKLVFDFGEMAEPSPLFLAYVRVEIDRTVMAPLYRSSRKMLDEFPEWMTLSELPEESATPEMATPTSIGGSFLNAVASEWLDDIRRELSYRDFQKYIDTVDLDQMAWAWRSSKLPQYILSIQGDGVELARTANQEEFRAAIDDDACYIDYESGNLYTTKLYGALLVNGEQYDQVAHQMWNYLDEIGLFVDLPRLHLESNGEYQVRVLDVYRNRGGVGVEQLKAALRRELSLWKYFDETGEEVDFAAATPAESATPDSDYPYALPEMFEMEDLEAMNDPSDPRRYFDPDGMPTYRFVELVERLSREYPTTWGRFSWGEAMWDQAGKDYAGYNVIPYRYDPDPPNNPQSGIGDGNDLFVFRPDVITGPRTFNANLIARGRKKVWRTEYPAVEFDMRVRGVGMRNVYSHPIKTVAFTIEITTNEATPRTLFHSFTMAARSDVDIADFESATPSIPKGSPASFAVYEIFSEDNTTSPEIQFRDPVTNALYNETGIVDIEDIAEIRLVQGRWQAGDYIQVETQDHFEAWFSYDEIDVLTFDSGPIAFTVFDDATPAATPDFDLIDMLGSSVVMRSLQLADPTPTQWASDPQLFSIKLNGVAPFLEPVPLEFDDYRLEYILWDEYVTDRFLEFQIESVDGAFEDDINMATPSSVSSVYGGITHDEENRVVFVPAELITIDGDASWIDGQLLLDSETESVTIAIASGPEYPIIFPVWEMFEETSSIAIEGVVDENGPWRNGVPPSPGNTNYNLDILENVTRADFSIPDDEDYMVTWFGVEADNKRVLVWLESNTVKPAILTDYVQYPETAIEEQIIEGPGTYFYSPIIVRARIKPEPDPEWNPQIHSGYFYDGNEEYYFYAEKVVEETGLDDVVLSAVARQGAPVIAQTNGATPTTLRQVAFFDEAATPHHLGIVNREWIKGTGHPVLYASYHDIYNITVEDADGNDITDDTEVFSNEISVTTETSRDAYYQVTYKVKNSFYVDNSHIEDGRLYTRVVFDAPPDDKYIITYEGSAYDPATPVDLPLNPMHSMRNEAFIFISHNEYTLDSIRVRLSSPVLLADGLDYIMVTIESLDENGNPKPNQLFNLSTDFGVLTYPSIETDHDGFGVFVLYSEDEMATPPATPTTSGTLSITGTVSLDIDFTIEEPTVPEPKLVGVVKAEKIQADGFSQNLVFGKLQDIDGTPIEGATVSWQKRRSLYELFTPDDLDRTFLSLDGENGTYASFDTATSINEDIEIEIDVHPLEWGVNPQTLVAQYVSNFGQRSWQLRTNETGGLVWSESPDGMEFLNGDIITALPVYGRQKIRVTRDSATGLVQAFTYQNNEWVLEGEHQGHEGPLHASDAPISVGAISNGVIHQLDGRVYALSVSHNGTNIVTVDFGDTPWEVGDEDITRGDWTLFGGAKISQGLSGTATTSASGLFSVGPFTTAHSSEPGYWFMSLEADVNGTLVGDVVFWYEYPTAVLGVENVDSLPQLPVQMHTPVGTIPPYSTTVKHPTSYNEQADVPDEQDPDIQWLPPEWFAISAWHQYQLGIRSHKIHKFM